MPSWRRLDLRTILILPVTLVVVGAVLLLVAVEAWAAQENARHMLDRRAEAVVAGIASRLKDRQHAKEVYVTLLAREGELPAATRSGDVPTLARILVPLKSTLGIGHIRVYNLAGLPLLALGDGDDATHATLLPDSRAGLTRSISTVGTDGLYVVAAAPIKGAAGIVGSLVVGVREGNEQLDGLRGRDNVELVVTRAGAMIATSARPGLMQDAAVAVAREYGHGAVLDLVAGGWGLRTAVHRLDDHGSLVALIPTNEIVAAAQRRSAFVIGGLLALVAVLALMGLTIARVLNVPLQAMLATAAGIREGRFDRRMQPSHIREFDIVGQAMNDLSTQVEDQLVQLTHQAFYDRLTDLPNRALLKDRLSIAAARATRRSGHVAVMFLDLDNFKVVNDSLGHEAGDQLLIALTSRLRECLRPEDTLARLGGDEFVVLVEEVADAGEACAIAERVLDHLARPYRIEGHDLFAMASIGIALSVPEAGDPEELMRHADVAMYHAKSQGKGRLALFEPSMNAHANDRLVLETDLRGAVERGEMRVAYQPIVWLESGRIIEVEALLRWDHPTRGLISPAQFIPIAEATGVIVQLGTWVLGEAARQARDWSDSHPHVPVTMSVNLSPRQLQHQHLFADVRRILRETGLDPKRLKLEITESAVMHDIDAAVVILQQLKTLGVQLAIDDFGTGYSSLAQLRRLPVDVIKIDRAFVNRLEQGPADVAIVRSIMDLATSLNLAVTSEGIETSAQADHLRELGCTHGQGFLYAHAMSPNAINDLLNRVPPELPAPARNRSAEFSAGMRDGTDRFVA